MKIIEGGVTAAKGFEAASTAAKIKYQDRTDMAMIYSQVPCECAGTFTTNVVKAACVKWDQQVVKSGAKAQAVIVNSGIANACTGAEGFGKDTADAAAEALGINADGVLIGSTGVIGKQLPIDRIVAGVKALAEKKNDTLANGTEAAKAIMTTDTCEKQIAVEIEVAGKTVTIVDTLYTESDLLTAMSAVETLLLSPNGSPDYILCLDETLISGAVRGIIDLNRVNSVDVAGIGYSDEIETYIQSGIVQITVNTDPFRMGELAVQTAVRACRGELDTAAQEYLIPHTVVS